MSWRDWSNRQKLRLQLSRLGQELATIKTEFGFVAAVSSRMVANRIHLAASDYWKAVEAYSRDEFEEARLLVKAGLVETGFIRKLMDAETAERELGESIFFEYADKKDTQASLTRIESSLDLISIELQSLLVDCKKAREST